MMGRPGKCPEHPELRLPSRASIPTPRLKSFGVPDDGVELQHVGPGGGSPVQPWGLPEITRARDLIGREIEQQAPGPDGRRREHREDPRSRGRSKRKICAGRSRHREFPAEGADAGGGWGRSVLLGFIAGRPACPHELPGPASFTLLHGFVRDAPVWAWPPCCHPRALGDVFPQRQARICLLILSNASTVCPF